MHDDTDVPVLNSVVKAGNESIIESTRLGREVLQRLEDMKTLDTPSLDPGVNSTDTAPIFRPGRGDGSAVLLKAESPATQVPEESHDPAIINADALDTTMSQAIRLEPTVGNRAGNPKPLILGLAPRPAPMSMPLESEEPDSRDAEESSEDEAVSGTDDMPDTDEALELMIDELVDRHVSALRDDLRRLLLKAQQN